MEGGRAEEGEVERLPVDLLAHIFVLLPSFVDLAQASGVCRKWREGALRSLARRDCLSFAGYRMDDDSAARLVRHAYSLRDLDISRSCWGCQITDNGLYKISLAKCIGNLTSISLWGMAGITDKGVIQLVRDTESLLGAVCGSVSEWASKLCNLGHANSSLFALMGVEVLCSLRWETNI